MRLYLIYKINEWPRKQVFVGLKILVVGRKVRFNWLLIRTGQSNCGLIKLEFKFKYDYRQQWNQRCFVYKTFSKLSTQLKPSWIRTWTCMVFDSFSTTPDKVDLNKRGNFKIPFPGKASDSSQNIRISRDNNLCQTSYVSTKERLAKVKPKWTSE